MFILYLCNINNKNGIMTFSDKINKALKEQGRTKVWLAAKLGVKDTSLITKIKNNTYSIADIYYISSLLGIQE